MQSSIIMFTHFISLPPEDQEEDRDEKEEGSSATSLPAAPTPIKCPLGSKPCEDNAECVLYNHVCDGEADCKDGSDEEDCLSACETGNVMVGLCGCELCGCVVSCR